MATPVTMSSEMAARNAVQMDMRESNLYMNILLCFMMLTPPGKGAVPRQRSDV
jgi:hypothetical protein